MKPPDNMPDEANIAIQQLARITKLTNLDIELLGIETDRLGELAKELRERIVEAGDLEDTASLILSEKWMELSARYSVQFCENSELITRKSQGLLKRGRETITYIRSLGVEIDDVQAFDDWSESFQSE